MPEVTVADYLRRIGYTGSTEPTVETLRGIVDAHLHTVPFENLDMLAQVPLDLSREALWDKVVARRRGGVCHQLNNSIGYLLRELGYEAALHSACVASDDIMEHSNLWVTVDGAVYLTDVGFGDHVVPLLKLEPGVLQEGYGAQYRFEGPGPDGTLRLLCRNEGADSFQQLYVLYPRERERGEFYDSYNRHAVPGASIFSTSPVVIRTTREARYALVKNKLTITPHGGEAVVVPAPDEETRKALLETYFGLAREG